MDVVKTKVSKVLQGPGRVSGGRHASWLTHLLLYGALPRPALASCLAAAAAPAPTLAFEM